MAGHLPVLRKTYDESAMLLHNGTFMDASLLGAGVLVDRNAAGLTGKTGTGSSSTPIDRKECLEPARMGENGRFPLLSREVDGKLSFNWGRTG